MQHSCAWRFGCGNTAHGVSAALAGAAEARHRPAPALRVLRSCAWVPVMAFAAAPGSGAGAGFQAQRHPTVRQHEARPMQDSGSRGPEQTQLQHRPRRRGQEERRGQPARGSPRHSSRAQPSANDSASRMRRRNQSAPARVGLRSCVTLLSPFRVRRHIRRAVLSFMRTACPRAPRPPSGVATATSG